MGWGYLGIIFAVCAVLCSVGFYKFVYFLSVGYGFAVSGGAVTVLILSVVNGWNEGMLWLLIIQTALFLVYGIRLSGFLIVREIKNSAYRKTLKEATGGDKKMPIFVLVAIWICVALLYTAQISPMFYRFMNGADDIVLPVIGAAISVAGLILESLSLIHI